MSTTKLTARQSEVVKLLADGKTCSDVGFLLGISQQTVKAHKKAVFERLRIHNITQLVKYAVATGITTAESWE